MLKNYFKIAFRNLWRHKIFSLINIMGLAIGMTACILICLYVSFELSYDSFHRKADNIYRIVSDLKTPDEVIKQNVPAPAVAPNLKDEFPEVSAFVRMSSWDDIAVKRGNIKLIEKTITWADSSFFEIFDFGLLKGDPHTALKDPHIVVISERTARKYFGSADPIGETLQFADGSLVAKVTGVMKDIPENSQIKADLLLSMSTVSTEMAPDLDKDWGSYGGYAYLMLKPGTNAKALERKFPAFLERRNGAAMKKAQMYPTLMLEPLRDVYLHSTRDGQTKENMTNVYVFSLVAIFIGLIVATIIVYNQMRYMRSRDLGFSKDQIMVMNTYGDPAKNAFRQTLSQIPGVKSVAMSANIPGSGNSSAYSEIENNKGVFQVTALDLYFVDDDYLDLFKMKVVAGRGFSRDFGTDSTQAMVL